MLKSPSDLFLLATLRAKKERCYALPICDPPEWFYRKNGKPTPEEEREDFKRWIGVKSFSWMDHRLKKKAKPDSKQPNGY